MIYTITTTTTNTERIEPTSLDITLTANRPTEVFEANITHNLATMAEEAGLYSYLWRPEELGITKAGFLIQPLTEGLDLLQSDKDYFKKFNPINGYGDYDGLTEFVRNYIRACKENPDADILVDR